MEHIIYFQAFTDAPSLAVFLLNNRLVKVQVEKPALSSVRVNLDHEQTVKPHHVVTLACLLEEYWLAHIPVHFENSKSVIYSYLSSIGFLQQWPLEPRLPTQDFIIPTDSTSFVFWKIEPESIAAYADSAYQHYKSGFFQGKDLSALPTYLAEMFNNVFDHAFAKGAAERIAYCMVQYYPATNRLIIAVADFGMGIPTSVNRYLESTGQPPLPAVKALRKALQLHFSAQSRPHNRGRGLDTLRTGLTALGGMLTIQTSQAIYHIDTKGTAYSRAFAEAKFPGTTVAIRLFQDKLPPEETDLLEDEASLF